MEKTIKYLENGEYHYATVKDVGDLAKLKTDSKDDLVTAINELFVTGGDAPKKPEGYDKLVDNVADVIQKQEQVATTITNMQQTSQLSDAEMAHMKQVQEELHQEYLKAVEELNKAVEKAKADAAALDKKTNDMQGKIDETFADVNKEVSDVHKQLDAESTGLHKDLDDTKTRLEATRKDLLNSTQEYGQVHSDVKELQDKFNRRVWSTDLDPVREQVSKNSTEVQQTKDELKRKADQSNLDLVTNSIEDLNAKVKQNASGLEVAVKRDELGGDVSRLLGDKTNLLLGTRSFSGEDNWKNRDTVTIEPGYYKGLKSAAVQVLDGSIYQPYRVKADTAYTFSFFAREDKDNPKAKLAIKPIDAKNINIDNEEQVVHITTEWQRFAVTFSADKECDVSIQVIQGPEASNNVLHLAGYKLELGKNATPWEPNEADVAENIEKNESRFNVFSDQITGLVKKQEQIGDTERQLDTRITETAEGLKQTSKDLEDANGKITEFKGQLESTAKGLKTEYEKYTNEAIGQISDSSLNLIHNSAFSNQDNQFESWQNISAKATVREDSNNLHWVELTQSGQGTDNPIGVTSNYFIVKQGKVTVAVDVKLGDKANLDNQNILLLELYDEGKKRVDFTDVSVSQLGLSMSVLNDHNVHRGLYRLGIDRKDVKYMTVKAILHRNGDLWLTNFSARLSSIDDGGYTPNPDDVNHQILKMNTKIEEDAEHIALKANSVDVTRDIKSAVDGVQIGGVNLAKNTSKEFTMGYGIPNTTWRDNSAFLALPTKINNGEILPQEPHTFWYSLTPGATYTQTIWVETDATPSDFSQISITWFVNGLGHDFQPARIVKLANNQYKIIGTYTWPGKTENNVRLFDIGGLNQAFDLAGSGTYLKFTKLKLEKGNQSTDYSTAPEDVSDQIESAKDAAIQVASDQINIHVNELSTQFDDKLNKRVNEVKTASEKFTSDGIEQTVKKITDVQNNVNSKLDNLQVGGRNLLRNSDKLPCSGNSNWSTGQWRMAGMTTDNDMRRVNKEIADSPCGKVNAISFTGVLRSSINDISLVAIDSLPISGNVTVSFWARQTGSVDTAFVSAGWTNMVNTNASTKCWGNTHYRELFLPKDGSWIRFWATFNVNNKSNVYIGAGNTGTSAEVQICLVKIETGTMATDWSPAPEDTQSQIEAVSSKIDQTATSITSTVNSTKQDLQGQIDSANTKITQTADSITEQLKSYSKTGDMQNYVNTTVQKTADGINTKVSGVESRVDSTKQDLQGQITQTANDINGKVSGVENKVDNASSKINDITSNGGGRNLWVGSKSFQNINVNSPEVDWNTDSDGIATAHITGTGGFYGAWQSIYANHTDPFAIGDSGTFSIEMKGTGTITIGREGDFQKAVTLTGNWTRYAVSGTVNSTNRAHIIYNESGKDCDAYVRLPMVEKGTIAHDWQPAPEDTQSQIDANKTSAANAHTSADNANTTANSALTKADSAVSVANQANTNASSAVNTANTANNNANQANTNASSAVNTANTANTTANSANSNANQAVTKASNAVNTANTANTNASSAVSVANNANITANTANSNANSANSNANQAVTKASNAVNTANTANTNASSAVSVANNANITANTANSNANSANNTANSAVTTANSAVNTANNANTTANQANSKVAAIQANGGGRNLLIGSDPTLSNRPSLGGVTEANIDGVKAWHSNNADNIFFNISLDANTTYTYSALIKADDAGELGFSCYGHFQVRNPNAHNQADPTHEDIPSKRDYHGINVPANQWIRIYYTFTTNDLDGSTFGVFPSYAGHTVYVRHLMLEKGTVAHDWSPAPEDVDAKITTNSTAIEQNKKAIALKADQTTVDQTNGTVQQLQSQLKVQADQISTKVSSTDFTTLNDRTMQNRGTVNSPDFNSLTQAGYYTITSPSNGKNYPTGSWGTLEVSGQVTDINGRLNQKYVSDNNGTAYTRQYNANTKGWTAWVKVANQNDIDTLNGKITTNTTAIEQNKKAIALKADQTTVDQTNGTVQQLQAQLKVQADQINSKVSSSDLDAKGYATQGYTQSLVTQKADQWNLNLTSLQTDVNAIKTTGGGVNLLLGTSGALQTVANASGWNTSLPSYTATATTVSRDTAYTAKGWIAPASYDASLQIVWQDSSGTTHYTNGSTVSAGSSGYSTWTGTITSGGTIKYVTVTFTTQQSTASSVSYKEVELEEGTVAHTWSPAPSDMATVTSVTNLSASVDGIKSTVAEKISELNTKWDVANGKIEGKVTETQVNDILNGKGYATQSWAQTMFQMKKDSITLQAVRDNITDGIQNQVNGINNKIDTQTLDSADINNMRTQGHYFVKNLANSPISGWVYVDVTGDNSSRLKQDVYQDNGYEHKSRRWFGSSWTEWTTDVNNKNIVSQINITPDQIKIASNKIEIDGNTYIHGELNVSNVKLKGSNGIVDLSGDGINITKDNGAGINIANNGIQLTANTNGQNEIEGVLTTAWNLDNKNQNGIGLIVTPEQDLGRPYGGDILTIGSMLPAGIIHAAMVFDATGITGGNKGFNWFAPHTLDGAGGVLRFPGAQDDLMLYAGNIQGSRQSQFSQPTMRLVNGKAQGSAGLQFQWDDIVPFGRITSSMSYMSAVGTDGNDGLTVSWYSWQGWYGGRKVPSLVSTNPDGSRRNGGFAFYPGGEVCFWQGDFRSNFRWSGLRNEN